MESLEDDFNTYWGPAGLTAAGALTIEDEFCMLQDAPPAAAADVEVVSVQKDTTATASTGSVDLPNSVIDGLTTETVIPQIIMIAPVTTADGLCAGFDTQYGGALDVDVYNTGDATLTVGTPIDLSSGTPNYTHIAEMYASPDQLNKDILAFKLVLENAADNSAVTEITCGRYVDDDMEEVTNMICNSYSTVIGLSGVADGTTSGITEMTAHSVPVFGDMGATQTSAYQSI